MFTAPGENTGLEKAPSILMVHSLRVGGMLLAGVCATLLTGACAARVQALPDTEPPVSTSPVPAPAASAAPPTPVNTAPRYSAKDIMRAFGFIDANKDGKISRQEASGFRNVAKYFDAADTNKDGALSLEEFGSALNRP